MTKSNKNGHWTLSYDDNDIAWLTLDKSGSNTNVLDAAVLNQLDACITELASKKPCGLVIQSGKTNGFIAGADIREFTRMKSVDEAKALITGAQAVFNQIEQLPFPTVALIHGFCLGGGMELAMACKYRIARDDESCRLGLPEIKLGIHPGFGGTGRATRLCGAPSAMDLMLTGRTISARAARKVGLIDVVVPERQLQHAVLSTISEQPGSHQPPFWTRLLNLLPIRILLAKYLRRSVSQRAARGHYPAPYKLIDLWERHGGDPQAMMAAEVDSVAELVLGDTAQNLIRSFFLSETLKEFGKRPKGEKFTPQRVHVIGAGVMGGDIAAWCALKGYIVSLQDQRPEALAGAIKRAYGLFKKKLKQPRLVTAAMDRLMPDINGTGVDRADVVIEAIFEDLDAKQALYKDIEPRLKADALLATNTSSIPLEKLGKKLQQPQRLVGLHFFNPVAKMPLVEIVTTATTDEGHARHAAMFARDIGRLPLPVKSSPGFLVNRILMPYLLEAVSLREEGVAAELIDKAATDFGMPMGPVRLADTVGLDICLSVAETLARDLPVNIPKILRDKVAKKQLGVKTGAGFYTYDKKSKAIKSKNVDATPAPADLTDRLIYSMLNEAVCCLREAVVGDADLLDAGVIFGTGFAPFLGGPVHYIQTIDSERALATLNKLKDRHGERFNPDSGWQQEALLTG